MKKTLLVLLSFLYSAALLCYVASAENAAPVDYASQPYYHQNVHGPQKSYAQIEIQMKKMQHSTAKRDVLETKQTQTYEVNSVSTAGRRDVEAQFEALSVATDYGGQLTNGRFVRLNNPLDHFSIQEPKAGCAAKKTFPVRETAEAKKCLVATNAGFFNTHTYECLGNLVSDEKEIQRPMIHNVNFGITTDGKYVVGYLDEAAFAKYKFAQLIAGVVWLVRDGRNYVTESAALEDMHTQETGANFVSVRASRVALGHTRDGKLIMLYFDGDGNHQKGPNLAELADTLVQFGAVNAINLDGGGSTTMVIDNRTVSYVSDGCPGSAESYSSFTRCERKVTTITCIHNLNYKNPKEQQQPQQPQQEDQHQKKIDQLQRELDESRKKTVETQANLDRFGTLTVVLATALALVLVLAMLLFCSVCLLACQNFFLMNDDEPMRIKSGDAKFGELEDESDDEDIFIETKDVDEEDAQELQVIQVEKAAAASVQNTEAPTTPVVQLATEPITLAPPPQVQVATVQV